MLIDSLLIACGGFFGSMARFYFSRRIRKNIIATWLVNLVGSIMLAIILKITMLVESSTVIWPLLGIGFCGAFTTFSTFSVEVLQLSIKKQWPTIILYTTSSLLLTLTIVLLILYI